MSALSANGHLSPARIQTIAASADVDHVAVENFLSTIGGQTTEEALQNLRRDAESYGWSKATARAIRLGIYEARLT